MEKIVSFIFHIIAMILLIVTIKDDYFIHMAIMAECMAIYFKSWDDKNK